jgi:predicted RNA-binding protein with PUA-like domain
MLGSESQWLVGSYTCSPDRGQVTPGMPSSRDSFRRNRVAPVGISVFYHDWRRGILDSRLFAAGWTRVDAMESYYLLKTEPSEYSFTDLQRDKKTEWDGVSNPVALKNMREMTPGTRLIIYETGERKTAVGTATVVSLDASNPKNPRLLIEAGKPIAKPVSLMEIKANKLFASSPLVRQGRLSVVPLTAAQYQALVG